jgi:hypothetical protein
MVRVRFIFEAGSNSKAKCKATFGLRDWVQVRSRATVRSSAMASVMFWVKMSINGSIRYRVKFKIGES